MRICIIDDNCMVADALALNLEMQGHEVAAFYSGAQGAREAPRTAPDVVVIDRRMPDMDGETVAQKIRGECDALLVLMSGDPLRAGDADCVIQKPFTPAELMRLIENRLASGNRAS